MYQILRETTFISCLFIFKFFAIKSHKDYITNACLFKIDFLRHPKQHILVGWQGTWENIVSLLYHISMKIFRRVLLIRCWRFLFETSMVYSWVFWRYLSENLLWFSTIRPLKVSSGGLCEKTVYSLILKLLQLSVHLMGKLFPPFNQLSKLLKTNTVKVSYSCMLDLKTVINSYIER